MEEHLQTVHLGLMSDACGVSCASTANEKTNIIRAHYPEEVCIPTNQHTLLGTCIDDHYTLISDCKSVSYISGSHQ